MHLPLMPPISSTQVYMNGDVSIDDSAVLAPGAIVQADPDSKVIIAAGVCIGMGVIIHAHEGTIEIASGAILGAGVLVIGKGKIGANACIGAATTIYNSSVEPWQLVKSGSLIGDTGHQVTSEDMPATQSNGHLPLVEPHTPEETPTEQQTESPPPAMGVQIYGQANLNRLIHTLFPHKQSLNNPSE